MQNSNDSNNKPLRKKLIANSDIAELKNREEGTITENELKRILRRYNLRDGLIIIGKLSSSTYSDKSKHRVGKAAVVDPETGVFITQFALAYLANSLITSGANDFKSKQIGEHDNLLTLLNIYSNSLVSPDIRKDDEIQPTKKDFVSFLVRMSAEQFEYQFNYLHSVARTIVIFTDIINIVIPEKSEPFDIIFEKETGLSFKDYFALVFAAWAASQETATFKKEDLVDAQIPGMKSVLTDRKITSFLSILSIDYKKFREEDNKANKYLNPIFTKTRFNPLLIYPIIETDKKLPNPYVVPNSISFLKRGYNGLYWWFHRHFEGKGKQQDFRNYYGGVFEQYLGRILKKMYGENNVHPEIIYNNNSKFIDWWVEHNSTIYLFEAKANQFALPTKQTGDIELLLQEVRTKIAKSIKQVYKRLLEINKYKELSIFRGKKIIPIIVFLEIPLISGHLYRELIDEELQIFEDKGLTGIKSTKIYFLNIEELEQYDELVNIIPIEDVFAKYEDDMSNGFLSVIQKELGRHPRNTYLDKIYNDFWTEMTGTKYPKKLKNEE